MKGDGVIRGVIFDLGSTLIRFNGDWPEMLQESSQGLTEVLEQEGYSLDSRSFIEVFTSEMTEGFRAREKDWIERTTSSLLRKVMSHFGHEQVSDETVDRALVRFYAVSEGRWEPMDGVYGVLDELRESGLRLGLISNAGDENNVQRLIDSARLRSYFDPILISAAEGIRKPNPRLFETVLEAWAIPAHQVVMIGDSLAADILGAQHTGLHQIWLTAQADTPSNRAHADVIVPEAIAEDITDIPAQVRRLAEMASGG